MTKYLPQPSGVLDRSGRAWAFEGLARSEPFFRHIEWQSQEIRDGVHRLSSPPPDAGLRRRAVPCSEQDRDRLMRINRFRSVERIRLQFDLHQSRRLFSRLSSHAKNTVPKAFFHPSERNWSLIMPTSELSKPAAREQAAARTVVPDVPRYAVHFTLGALQFMLDESIFAGWEVFERTKTEMHLLSEFAAKMASAHSVRDLRTMYAECSKHQIEFIARDCDRLFKHSEHMIDSAGKLFTVGQPG